MKNYSLVLFLILIPVLVQAQYPRLDENFKENGQLTIPDFRPLQIVVQEDGNILVLGQTPDGRRLIQTNADGKINEQFGGTGSILLPFVNYRHGFGVNIYLQPDGKILIAGTNRDESLFEDIYSVITLTRLHQDGSVDTDFGDNGIVHLNNSIPALDYNTLRGYNSHGDLVFQNNKILIAGSSTIPYPLEYAPMDEVSALSLFRLNMDGTLDEAFGIEGTERILKLAYWDEIGITEEYENFYTSNIKLQSDGRIVVFGSTHHSIQEGTHLALMRIFPDGTLDESFNNEIRYTLRGAGPYEGAIQILVLENDAMILSATHHEEYPSAPSSLQLIGVTKDGEIDPDFGRQGIVPDISMGPGQLILVEDGVLLLTATGVWKRRLDGSRDMAFERSGVYRLPNLTAFGLQTQNKLLIGSYHTQSGTGAISRHIIAPDPEEGLPKISRFTLVNAQTNEELYDLENGATINLRDIGTREINIRAYTDPEPTGSVVFSLSGQQTYNHIENVALYALFANRGSNYNSWRPSVGFYQLTATAHTLSRGGGEAGPSSTISFNVIDEAIGLQIVKFTLIDAFTNRELFELTDGQVINLQEIGTKEINIRAYTNPEPVGSVLFNLRGAQNLNVIENHSYYALFRNAGENFFSWTPPLGNYSLTATAFESKYAKGEAGTARTLSFTIEDDGQISARVYPNPGQNWVHIPIDPKNMKKTKIKMFDLAGKQVNHRISVQDSEPDKLWIDVRGLEGKTYIIQVVTGKEVKNIRWKKE